MSGDDYMRARQEWEDRFLGQRKTVRLLVALSAASLAIGGLGLCYGAWASINSRFVPYVVAVDKIGRTVVAPSPETVDNWPPAVIRRELANFVRNLRTITPDLAVLRRQAGEAAAHLHRNSAAFQKISDYFRSAGHMPVEEAKTETVSVDVGSVNHIGGSSWRVEWTETAYGRQDGKLIGKHDYVATMIVHMAPVHSASELESNPLGLFVDDIDIQEVHV
ncbi:MAG: hypothetical protein KGN33_08010 [Paracoccaceae bacterium]|nr:hypothetical protein [Paracoccaceae bacterium]